MRKGGRSFGFFYNKKAQVTLFIIIAIVIVAAGVLIYLFYPQISTTFSREEQSPTSFIQNCMNDEIKEKAEIISRQGGSLNPEFFILHQDDKIQYLCYTEDFYKTCVVQKPLLKKQIEKELEKGIENKAKECFRDLKLSFERRNYGVSLTEGKIKVELLPQKIVSTFNYTVTLTRAGADTERYESFNVVLNNNLYELASIADSIIDLESTYGDADSSLYMELYHNLKVEKRTPEYGTTVYILTDRTTNDRFQFASRSVVMPPGYGTDLV